MVVVGAGEAGARAASALRERGYDGLVTLVGDEPHAPYERPPLSKAVMASDDEAPPVILDEGKLAAQRIAHLAGARATHIDRDARVLHLADGRDLPYAKLLIATGAGPRRLPVPGADGPHVLTLRTFADALALRARLVPGCRLTVVGGGFIGLEVAAAAAARDCAVTLVEAAPRILMRGVPTAVADRVARRHLAAGVDLRTGFGIAGLEARPNGVALLLVDGTQILSDAVVVGIGAVPETRLAEASGLAVENGVRVNAQLRTEDPNIFAAGDCCSFPHPLYGGRRIRLEAWRNAQNQGALAAANMLGGSEAYAAVPWFWSDQYDETLQVAGLSDEAVDTIERDLGAGRLFFCLAADGRLVAASGVGPNGVIARDIRLAEMMIARRACPDRVALASPSVKLKALLAA
ncbi:NAD(P)/FAD-dependent oxidoreductase [Lichenibacterium ramalinae]|uniref:Ferredoxin reductase n=1 Tax=Lichenibacterium ramalinae TaxID=2316527 RepID=A0A4V1RHV7_9HYPH|nr:FAD-dependent oxidoreductase [Lichenibacterium ramalinae]RYB01387.1 ferredoxin reductase [Lichenibacterium ramalinae]